MKFQLINKIDESRNIKTFIFKPESPIKWTSGQYLIYSLPHENIDNRGKMRFFTISTPPFEKNPSITTKIINKSSSFKKALNNLKLGESIEAKGPDGDFIINDLKKKYIFIAGGMGITPFNSILKQLDFEKKPINITLFYTSNDEFLFKDFFDRLASENKQFNVYYLRERINKDILLEKIKKIKEYTFYVSGPDPMVEDLENLLKKMGVKEEKLKTDYFSGYKTV